MKKLINRIVKGLTRSRSGTEPWLAQPTNPFLFTLHLTGVDDPMDGDQLWEHEFGGGVEIREVFSDRKDLRLRAALDAHRQVAPRSDPAHGGLVEDHRVFTDVLIRIPRSSWRRHHIVTSGRIPVLLDRLARLHREEFGGQLLGDRTPRYQVAPEDGLGEGEVLCQFGLGVFIPDGNDRLRGEASVCMDAQEQPLPDWEGYQTEAALPTRVRRPSAIYRGQHYLLLAGDPRFSAIRSPLWPQGLAGYALVNLTGDTPELEPEVGSVRGAGAQRDEGGAWVCRFAGPNPRASTLLEVKLRLDTPATEGVGLRGRPGLGVPPPIPYLLLTGIALPQVEHVSRLVQWSLRLDAGGFPAAGGEGATLLGKRGMHGVQLLRPGSIQPHSVFLPSPPLEIGPGCTPLRIDPLALDGYLGLLRLERPVEYRLPPPKAGGLVIGRAPGSEAAGEAEIRLNLLEQQGSMLWEDGSTRSVLNDLVSARFARLIPEEEGVRVTQLSERAQLHILDSDLRPLRSVDPGSHDAVLLSSGQHLLLGLYLFRFQLGRATSRV